MKEISSEDKTINSLCQKNFFKTFSLIQVGQQARSVLERIADRINLNLNLELKNELH